MVNPTELSFNPKPSTLMHLDLNSCFATIEQQANPLLRGRPVVVAAYATNAGCILAPSIEAKRYGVKTGMRVGEGKLLYPDLIVLPSDPAKYRNVHLALRKIMDDYTNDFTPKSIDEFVLNLEGYPSSGPNCMQQVAREIKERIKKEVGEWLTVSIGISTNRFLAKLAASLHKPDGLDEINKDNYLDLYSRLRLTDLYGIAKRNAARLNRVGICTVFDFYNAPLWQLKVAFSSIGGYYWYLRLRGWEIDDFEVTRRSFGNSYALPYSDGSVEELAPILQRLVEKTGARLRRAGYKAKGVHLALAYKDGTYWHRGETAPYVLFDSRDIFKEALAILKSSPLTKPVHTIAVSCFNLIKGKSRQLNLFDDVGKKQNLVNAVDKVNERWGDFVVTQGSSLKIRHEIADRISFGGVREL